MWKKSNANSQTSCSATRWKMTQTKVDSQWDANSKLPHSARWDCDSCSLRTKKYKSWAVHLYFNYSCLCSSGWVVCAALLSVRNIQHVAAGNLLELIYILKHSQTPKLWLRYEVKNVTSVCVWVCGCVRVCARKHTAVMCVGLWNEQHPCRHCCEHWPLTTLITFCRLGRKGRADKENKDDKMMQYYVKTKNWSGEQDFEKNEGEILERKEGLGVWGMSVGCGSLVRLMKLSNTWDKAEWRRSRNQDQTALFR